MKLLIGLLLSVIGFAQTKYDVALTWIDGLSGASYTVYRAPVLCSGSTVFSKIASAVPAKAYRDANVKPGNYCYRVTAVVAGKESLPSNALTIQKSLFRK